VPINAATRRVVSALLSDGRVRRGYLGIAGAPRPLPPTTRERWGAAPGIELVEVMPDSPAAVAGLRAGDLLVEIDGRRLTGVQDVQRLMEDEVIGSHVVVTALRDGLERQMTVVPRELGR
jgi:S1-C subfamily serine protease